MVVVLQKVLDPMLRHERFDPCALQSTANEQKEDPWIIATASIA